MSQHVAELISMGLTPSTILLGILVVVLWWPSFRASVSVREKTASNWFVMGVFIGFLGGCADNLYWSFPWSAKFLGAPCGDFLVDIGVYFNIFSRQLAGTAAAYCHIRAHQEFNQCETTRRKLLWAIVLSVVFGVLWVAALAVAEKY